MKINFSEIPEKVAVGLRGGQGETRIKSFQDKDNRVLMLTLSPGAVIGKHSHETDSETMYFLSGEGLMESAEGKLPVKPGDCHYCGKGQWHSLHNTGKEDLVCLAVIPTHPV